MLTSALGRQGEAHLKSIRQRVVTGTHRCKAGPRSMEINIPTCNQRAWYLATTTESVIIVSMRLIARREESALDLAGGTVKISTSGRETEGPIHVSLSNVLLLPGFPIAWQFRRRCVATR